MSPASSDDAEDTNKQHNSPLTLLDRSVSIILQDPDPTASGTQGISHTTERLHRLHGTSLIFEASKLLSLGASTYATACTIFHRFYHQASLTEHDVWSVAMASTLLATKVEEESHTLKAIIHAFCQLYRKRLLVVTAPLEESEWDHPSLATVRVAKTWTCEEKELRLAQLPLPMKLGPVFREWHQQVFQMEATVLRQLGFTLYWIPDSHPHKFILYFCQVLELTDAKVRAHYE
jgi:hypothetical protein